MKMNLKLKRLATLLLIIVPQATQAASFTAGNLAVFSADSASANNTTFSIIELSTNAAAAVQTIAINGTTMPNALRSSGSASSTGYLADSDDGSLLVFTGHNTNNTAGNINTMLPRGVGALDGAGNFTLRTTDTGASGNQTRSATSTNNTLWYIGDQGGIYTNGTAAPQNNANVRSVKSFGGTVYVFRQSTTAANTVVATLSADGTTLTGLTGLTNSAGGQDFYLISSGSNGSTFDVLYITTNASTTVGGILKYSLVSGVWTSNGSYATSFGGFGLCAARDGNGAVLYVTTGNGATAANSVIKLTDSAGFNTPINITGSTTIYTAAAGTGMKGIAFAPVGGGGPPPTYTVTYAGNQNTGGAAPTDSTAYTNTQTVVVLGQGTLTRTGYNFTGWNTAANGSGTGYSAGNTFAIAANTTLYAQWSPINPRTVTYNGNGNTGGNPPLDANSPYASNETVTVLGNTGNLTRSGYTLTGWNTAADGSGTGYSAGDSFAIEIDTTLYAQWSQNPPVTAGNLMVFSADNATVASTTFSILELNSSATNQPAPVQTIAINGTTGPNALRTSGSATSTGYLADSDDGTLLAFTGHNTTNTSGNVNTILPRAVGTLNNAGSFTLQTTYTGTSGNQTRCATTVSNGLWYIGDQGGVYTNGTTSPQTNANVRGVKSFAGTAYVMQQSASAPVVSSLSADGKTLTGLPGLANDSSAVDFYLIASGNNGATADVLYVLENFSGTTALLKYSLVGSSWAANSAYVPATSFGGFGLCAATSGAGAVLYATTGTGSTPANRVIKMTDTAGYNADISINDGDNVTLYTAAAGATLKGIAFAPVAGSPPPPPVASFTADQTSGTAPLTVTFTNTSTGTITDALWNFGDNSASNTTALSVQHTYGAGGPYTVTLVVTGPDGAGTNTQSNLITAWTAFQTWQLQYFGCLACPPAALDADPDGDGMNNEAEFLAGTIPTNSASSFRILSVVPQNGTNIVVTWSSVPGRTNVVQASSTPGTNGFADVSGPIYVNDTVTNFLDMAGATNFPGRFYRVQLVP